MKRKQDIFDFILARPRLSKIIGALFILTIAGCSNITWDTSAPTLTLVSTPTPRSLAVTFEVIFDEEENCIVRGPTEVPTGEYLFLLNNQSDRKVSVSVTHLIDGHTFQDLLDLQDEYGEPFVIEYWMSQPYYFTRDHKVWHYSLGEAGEYAILIVQYVFEGKWICQPIQVMEPE